MTPINPHFKQLHVPEEIRNNPVYLEFTASILQAIYPNYSHCERCGLTWNACYTKSVPTSQKTATFATCKRCWNLST